MNQLFFIHGGETFKDREEFLGWLQHTATYKFEPENLRNVRWHKHLQTDLGDNWEVHWVTMPTRWNAHYDEWKIWMKKVEAVMRDGCVLVGHSLGANFLAKYIEDEDLPYKPASLHMVAGCFGDGYTFSIDGSLEEVTWKVPTIFIYHSKDDLIVPFSDAEKYKEHLPNAELIVFEKRGHFLDENFPELLEQIKKVHERK